MEMNELMQLTPFESANICGGSNWVDNFCDFIHEVRGSVDGFIAGLFLAEANRVAKAGNASAVVAYK